MIAGVILAMGEGTRFGAEPKLLAELNSGEIVSRFVAEAPGARAVYNGRPDHPIVLGPDEIRGTMSLTEDRGARGLLQDGPRIELGGRRDLGRDVHTTEDLERMRNEARAVV